VVKSVEAGTVSVVVATASDVGVGTVVEVGSGVCVAETIVGTDVGDA
jgi:predicted RecA/RadA family phage recombinase